jgi:hypothetical protein
MSTFTTKVFTREAACNKMHIWNCFRARSGFRIVEKQEAKSHVGANAPRVMLKAGRLEEVTHKGKTCLKLTKKGEKWATAGVTSFLRNHPDQKADVKNTTKTIRTDAGI